MRYFNDDGSKYYDFEGDSIESIHEKIEDWDCPPGWSDGRLEPITSSTDSKPSGAWYLAPILFGILGGIMGYFAVRKDDGKMADNMVVTGIAVSIISFFIFMIFIW